MWTTPKLVAEFFCHILKEKTFTGVNLLILEINFSHAFLVLTLHGTISSLKDAFHESVQILNRSAYTRIAK